MRVLGYTLILVMLAACAGNRPLESSQKRAPDWLHGVESGFVIALGRGGTHEEARDRAMTAVREQIINAIAVQVVSSSELVTREESQNQVTNFVDHFESTVDVNSEYFDALKGISVTRVDDFYWEQYRKNGGAEVVYHVKYPFSDAELQGLIADFEAYDRAIERKIVAIENEKHYVSVEAINQNIGELDYLQDIASNDKRKRAKALKTQLEYMIMDIRIARLEDRPGFIRYQLRLYDRPIETRQTPDIYATCPIDVNKVTAFPDFTEVDYDIKSCNERGEHTITLSYDFDGIRIERNFSFSR